MAAPAQLPPRRNVYQAAAEYRTSLLAREQSIVDDTVRRWLIARHRIERELDALINRVSAALAKGMRPVVLPYGGQFAADEFSASWLYRIGRLETLAATIEGELATFNRVGLQRIASRAKTEVGIGEFEAKKLLGFRVRQDGLVTPKQFAQLPAGALEQITAMVGPGGPLPKAFAGMGPELVQQVQQRLVDGIARGTNPRLVARQMLQDTADGGLFDRPLYEQMRVARTEPLRAYRESTRLTFRANADVVAGWEWRAFPGPRTCAYCLAMDGSIHNLDEVMATHPQCRCGELPVTVLSDDPAFTGAEYLYDLSPGEQDQVFGGHTMGELYRKGAFRLSDIPEQWEHPDWGRVGRAASMSSLEARGVISRADIVAARTSQTQAPLWAFQRTQPTVMPHPRLPIELPPPAAGVDREQPAALLTFGDGSSLTGQETLDEFEAKVRAQGFESAGLYSQTGKVLAMKDGAESSIQFTADELALMKGAVLSHNHPSGSAFSAEDVKLMLWHQLAEIRAVSTAADYSLKGTARKLAKQYSLETAEDVANYADAIYFGEYQALMEKYRQLVVAGKMNAADAWRAHSHELMQNMAKRVGLTYRRKLR